MNRTRGSQSVHWGAEKSEVFLQNFLANGMSGKERPDVLLVTGRSSWSRTGAEATLMPVLDRRARVHHYSDFTENPKFEDLERALAVVRGIEYQCVLAIGGGTVLDMAKLLNLFLTTGLEPDSFLSAPTHITTPLMPFLAVPTTAGTGSEATRFAVLYRRGVKHSIEADVLKPSHVLLNAEFTATLPPYAAACSGFDALAQAIESYWALGSMETSRRCSAEALTLALSNLEEAVLCGTTASRAAMLRAAYLSGYAIDIAKTTAAHAFSYSLTAHYGLPHGHAVATFLPNVLRQNASAPDDAVTDVRGASHLKTVMAELLRLLGCCTAEEGAQRLEALRMNIGLTDDWMDKQGLTQSDIYDLALGEANPARLRNNPVLLARNLFT